MELLHALSAIRFGGVDVALGIGGDAVDGIELRRAGGRRRRRWSESPACRAEVREPSCSSHRRHINTSAADPAKAPHRTSTPSPSVSFGDERSLTYVPSVLKTWMRSLVRSQTYSRPSLASATPCTGVRNCFGGGSLGLYGGSSVSSGLLPYAPQCRLYLPVSASKTITRRLP